MKIGVPIGVTRVLGEDQGYLPLPVRDWFVDQQGPDGETRRYPVMFTVWHPTPEELAALNRGGCVVLGIMGTQHPPVIMDVSEPDFSPEGQLQ